MTLSPLMQAVEHLERGDWTAAHALAQGESGGLGFWAHGIVHLIEGDIDNARYWYGRAHRMLPDASAVKAEIAALRDAVQSGTR